MLSSQNVGVIVRLERENFHVLGMNGKCIECKPTALHKRRENQNTVALDADQNQIRRRDIVKVMEGPHAVSKHKLSFYKFWILINSHEYLNRDALEK